MKMLKVLFLLASITLIQMQNGCLYGGDVYTCGAKVPSGQYCNACSLSSYSCVYCLCSNYFSCSCNYANYCKNAVLFDFVNNTANFTK